MEIKTYFENNMDRILTDEELESIKPKNKYNIEYVSAYIRAKGCELLSDSYEKANKKLIIKFECGHICELIWNDFQQGKRCVQCGIKTRSNKHRTKEEDIIKYLEDNNFTFIDFPDGYKTQRKSFVRYSCNEGHITTRAVMNIYKYTTCKKCEFNDLAILHTGSANKWWKGGITEISLAMRNNINDWKKDSSKNCDYKCVITGDTFNDIHHLYSFNLIIKESLDNLNLDYEKIKNKYFENEMNLIIIEVTNIHNKYPLGVCLRSDIHDLFHKMYGVGDTTPDQWYEFEEKIKNGQIIIGKEDNL